MGFKDIKPDGLSKDLIEKERDNLLDEYFGTASLDIGRQKGQFDRFEKLKNQYINAIISDFNNYFKNIGYCIENSEKQIKARINDKENIILSLFSYEIFFNVTNKNLKYHFNIISDFKDIEYYKKSDKGRGWTDRYERCGGTPLSLKVLKDELEEMKSIIHSNQVLNDNYNFRIEFYEDIYKEKIFGEYLNIKDFLDLISDKYF